MDTRLAEVAFAVPLDRFFDYRIPPDLHGAVCVGQRVWAPFGKRARRMGVVTRLHEPEAGGLPAAKLKDIDACVEPEAVLDPRDMALAHWMSRRYSCSPGEALFTVFPLGQRKPPQRPAKEPVRARETPTSFEPTEGQTAALEQILPALAAGAHRRVLVQGVAASGKTEIYRRAISAALDGGRGALLLVPEIGLTPQMEDRLRGWFADALEVWHSEMALGDRWRVWRRVRSGQARVVVGPRSALFLPVTPLGLIVIDEEHDASYKQDNAPHYHARDTAEEKARLHGAVLLLGSATPSLETHARAQSGDIDRVVLTQRVENRPFPSVRLVDRRNEGWYFSDLLVNALRERLARGEQSMLFLNRRGYSTHVECRACGWVARCPACQVSLVLHRDKTGPSLRCHTCDHMEPLLDKCPTCRGEVLKISGRGTQRVAADVAALFPTARIFRWDRDAVRGRQGHEQAYRDALNGKIDIIVGTQMIVQGHDFPNLTLVGVLDADRSLSFPDFRAAERTFQLLMQVAGRAGRADRPGEVLIQTSNPDHYALQAVLERDYGSFAQHELNYRREADYPPFTRVVHAVIRARTETAAQTAAEQFVEWIQKPLPAPHGTVLGPAPAFHKTKAGWAQWQAVIKAPASILDRWIRRARDYAPPTGTTLHLDVDPETMA